MNQLFYFYLLGGGRSIVIRAGLLVLALALARSTQAQTEPTIVSTVPPNFSTGVSPSAAVVFTFSEPMDPDATSADFFDSTTFNTLPTSPVWSSGNKVLTCTPTPAFPLNKLIIWSVSGQNPNGDPIGGEPGGAFTTGTSGGGTGSGTNRVTEFSVGRANAYEQTSTANPLPDSLTPYAFTANTILASNRTATAVKLTLPGGAISNLMQVPTHPELFILVTSTTNQNLLETTYAPGNYVFNVQAPTSNQQVTVNFPASLVQPAAPHVSNFTAVRSVNAAQPFTLSWDAFPGGTANDYIHVHVGTEFITGDPGKTGALNGTATSVTIPAGTLQANQTYEGTIGFYHAAINTFGTSHVTTAYRATLTHFDLVTTGPPGGTLILTNAAWNGLIFSFDVLSAAGQTFTIDSANFVQGPWQPLVTTNSPSGRLQIIDLNSLVAPSLFYRARNGF